MDVMAKGTIGAMARQIAAVALLCTLAACGGGSSDGLSPAPLAPPPTTGTVTIPAGSEILALSVGAADQIIYVMPGESTAHRIELLNADATARYDVTVTDGKEIARAVETDGRWAVVVDSQSLTADTARAYRLLVRNRTTGLVAEIYGPIKVLAPSVVGSGQISAAGGTVVVSDGLGQLVFEPRAGAPTLGVTVLTAESPGGKLLRVRFDKEIGTDDRNLTIQLNPDSTVAGAGLSPRHALDGSGRMVRLGLAPGFFEVAGPGRNGVFTLFAGFRLAIEPRPLRHLSAVSCGPNPASTRKSQICGQISPAWKLSRRAQGTDSPHSVEPVLFVHGYTPAPSGTTLGGGEGTWNALPRLVEEQLANSTSGLPVRAYEFQWATNARFEQVADDLARAVDEIFLATGVRVTIVAHSFGGNLVRTMLQDLGSTDRALLLGVATKIRQVVTLGTPHSGIALPVAPSLDFDVASVHLPLGRDSSLLEICGQITCHQMGADSLTDDEAALIGIPVTEGFLAARLSLLDVHPISGGVPFAVGIGLGLQHDVAAALVSVTNGDGLISFDGQRFKPNMRFDRDRGADYLNCDISAGAPVREEVLVDAARLPFRAVVGNEKGLVHTASQLTTNPSMSLVNLKEAAVDTIDHPSFKFVKRVIEVGVCPTAPRIDFQPQSISVQVGQPATFSVTASGSSLSYKWFRNADTVPIPNATASSYTIDSVSAADDGARFSVVVSNLVGSTTSASAILTISMADPAPSQMQRIATGYGHTCAVTTAGGLKCWGGGPLGDGGTWGTSRLTPVNVVGLSSGVTAVSAGWFRTCAITNLGGVKCWGSAFPGSGLGDGTSEERLVPVDVVGLGTGVAAVDVGGDHVCALTTAGGVKCWGKNNYGQLGDGTFEDRLTPVNVVGLSSDVVAVSAGDVHTCAVTNLGRVKCWGMNHAAGSLGDGTTTYRFQSTPVDVVGLDGGVAAIAVGGYRTCVLKTEGAVLCWGASGGSGVGDGTDANRSTPVGVFGLSAGVTAIAHGNSHACALTRGGAIKCWGSSRTESYAGGLGDGTSAGSLAPVDAFGLSSGAVAVAAGAGHTCVLMAAGNAKCWGVNYLGGLGDGTQIDRYTPVDVVGF